MKTDREKLENQLKIIIPLYNNNKIINEVTKKFNKKGILPGKIRDIFSGRFFVEMLDITFLCLFTKYLYESIDEEKKDKRLIDPKKYFTDREIEESLKFHVEAGASNVYPIIFEPMIQVTNDQWIGKISIHQLVNLYNNHVINYDPEAQRELEYKKIRDTIIPKIHVNNKSVAEIENEIVNNKFISNMITLNMVYGESEFEYDNEKILFKAGKINIADGWHRSRAFMNALAKHSDINYTSILMLTHFENEKTNRFIIQEDNRNKIAPRHIKSIKDNYSNSIVSKINEDKRSLLKNKIVKDKKLLAITGVILFDELSDVINIEFKPGNSTDVVKIGKFIIEALNYIIESNLDILNETNQMIWIAYIIMLKKVYEAENWKEKLDNLITKTDFEQISNIDYRIITSGLIQKIGGMIYE